MRFDPRKNEAANCWTIEDGQLKNGIILSENGKLILGSEDDNVVVSEDKFNPPSQELLLDEAGNLVPYIARAVATVVQPRNSNKKPFIVLSGKANGSVLACVRAQNLEVIGKSAKILISKNSNEYQEFLVQLPGIVKISDETRSNILTSIHTSPTRYDTKLHTEEQYQKYRERMEKKGLRLEEVY